MESPSNSDKPHHATQYTHQRKSAEIETVKSEYLSISIGELTLALHTMVLEDQESSHPAQCRYSLLLEAVVFSNHAKRDLADVKRVLIAPDGLRVGLFRSGSMGSTWA